MARRQAVVAVALLGVWSLGSADPQERRLPTPTPSPDTALFQAPRPATPFVLELPELGLRVGADSMARLPRVDVSRMRLHIARSASQVAYGDVHVKVNTEAANIVMTLASTTTGLVADLDLGRRAGFRLGGGRNSVEVDVLDRMRRRSYGSFLLVGPDVAQSAAVPVGGAPMPLEGQRWAVIVGVSDYRHSDGIPDLRYAARDATAFRDFLLSPRGGAVPASNMLLLTDADATAERVRSALFTFLTRPAAEDDVYVYFAGHGAPDPNDPRNLYLLTHDTRIDDFGGTAFPMWHLQDVLGRVIKARRVVVLADACHSEGIDGSRMGGGNNLVNQYLARYTAEAQHALMTGSDVSESSLEDSRWGGGHGAFTFFLLQGLSGAADADRDGTVTAGELFPYVSNAVREATGGRQNPQALPGLAEGLPLAGKGLGLRAAN